MFSTVSEVMGLTPSPACYVEKRLAMIAATSFQELALSQAQLHVLCPFQLNLRNPAWWGLLSSFKEGDK